MSKLEELIQELCLGGVEYKNLGDVCTLTRGRVMSKDYLREFEGEYPVYSSQTANNGIFGYINTYDYDFESITWTTDGANAGSVFYHEDEKFSITNVCGLIRVNDQDTLSVKFVYHFLHLVAKTYVSSGMGNPKLMSNTMARVVIPLPPLPIQEEIVRILDNFTNLTAELTAELTARKKQYEYYRNYLLNFSEQRGYSYNWITLGDVGKVSMCRRIMKAETTTDGEIPFYKIGTFGKEPNAFISKDTYEKYKKAYSFPKKGDVLISAAGTIGRTAIYNGEPAYYQDSNIVWIDNDENIVLNKYLFYCYSMSPWTVSSGGTISRLYNDNISKAKIPVPPIEEQARIVSILDRFDTLCNDLTSGLPAEIEARQKQYEYYRDKLLTFKEVES